MTISDTPLAELKHQQLTQQILACAFEVSNELGTGFLESVYERALMLALQEKGMQATSQCPMDVYFRKQCIGHYYADIIVEEKVVVEVKASRAIAPEHMAQVINYLKATRTEVGLLLNFGNPKLEYKRLTRLISQETATSQMG